MLSFGGDTVSSLLLLPYSLLSVWTELTKVDTQFMSDVICIRFSVLVSDQYLRSSRLISDINPNHLAVSIVNQKNIRISTFTLVIPSRPSPATCQSLWLCYNSSLLDCTCINYVLPFQSKFQLPATSVWIWPGTFAELLHHVFPYLDLQCLSVLGKVNTSVKGLVKSLSSYSAVITSAPGALRALSATKLLVHQFVKLYVALVTDRCVCCDEYSPSLFLLICERCCLTCLCNDLSSYIMTVPVAIVFFGLNFKNPCIIPTMLSLPDILSGNARTRRIRSLSVKQARESDIALHDSEAKILRYTRSAHEGKMIGCHTKLCLWKPLAIKNIARKPRKPTTPLFLLRNDYVTNHYLPSIPFSSLEPRLTKAQHEIWHSEREKCRLTCVGLPQNLATLLKKRVAKRHIFKPPIRIWK